jgi:hypothetical protein
MLLPKPRVTIVGGDRDLVEEITRALVRIGASMASAAEAGSSDLDVVVFADQGAAAGASALGPSTIPRLGIFARDAIQAAELVHALDEFVVWPCDGRELAMRVAGLVRERYRTLDPATLRRVGPLVLDLAHHGVTISGRPVKITFMEFQLLAYLAEQKGRAIGRERLYRAVWGMEYLGGLRTVDVHVRRLRAKLGREFGRMLLTVRKVGYRLVDPAEC